MARLSSFIILLMAAALPLTACGGGSTPTPTPAHTTVPIRVEEGTLEEGAGPVAFLYFMEAPLAKYAAQGDASADFKLTLINPAPLVVFFTDRPHRKAGHEPLEDFLAAWDARGFGDVPPNATLVVPATASAEQTVLVAEIRSPRWAEAQELVFDGSVIHAHKVAGQGYSQEATAEVPESLESVFLFIDTVSEGCVPGRAAICPGQDFSESNLSGANFSFSNLFMADLTGAFLISATLEQAILREANLAGSNLSGANLAGANLTDADLTGAVFCNTVLPDGSISNANCP